MRRKMPALVVLAAVIFYAGLNASCCGWSSGVRVFLDEPFPEMLSAWRLFDQTAAPLRPQTGVVPYDLNTVAFPALDVRRNGPGERLIETRLLVRGNKGWVALPYIWNEAQTEAVLSVAGGVQKVTA